MKVWLFVVVWAVGTHPQTVSRAKVCTVTEERCVSYPSYDACREANYPVHQPRAGKIESYVRNHGSDSGSWMVACVERAQ
jgi:hypothetical protein